VFLLEAIEYGADGAAAGGVGVPVNLEAEGDFSAGAQGVGLFFGAGGEGCDEEGGGYYDCDARTQHWFSPECSDDRRGDGPIFGVYNPVGRMQGYAQRGPAKGGRVTGPVREVRDFVESRFGGWYNNKVEEGGRGKEAAVATAAGRRLSPEEQVSIVLESMRGDRELSRVCRHRGLSEEVVLEWRRMLVRAGEKALARSAKGETGGGAHPGAMRLSSAQKAAIVMEGLPRDRDVGEVCRRHRISPRDYRAWREEVLEAAKRSFARSAARGTLWGVSGRKAALTGALALGVAAAVFLVTSAVISGRPGTSGASPAGGITLIDRESLELFTFTMNEWSELSKKSAHYPVRYRNPRTGGYTLVRVMRCASCGKKIPYPDVPGYTRGDSAAITRALEGYICPRCGKKALSPMAK